MKFLLKLAKQDRILRRRILAVLNDRSFLEKQILGEAKKFIRQFKWSIIPDQHSQYEVPGVWAWGIGTEKNFSFEAYLPNPERHQFNYYVEVKEHDLPSSLEKGRPVASGEGETLQEAFDNAWFRKR